VRLTDFSPLSWEGSPPPSPDRSARAQPGAASPSEYGVSRASPSPPRGFKLIRGTPSCVRFAGEVPHNRGRTFAQKAGLRYEQKVHDILSAIYGPAYRPAPSILYEDRSGLRRAIPDGLLDLGDRVVVVEVKLTHCEKAWWQLNRLYVPLLRQLTSKPLWGCEVVRTYDPDVIWPGPHVITKSLHKWDTGNTGVIEWKL
jgi:hypothetical protein